MRELRRLSTTIIVFTIALVFMGLGGTKATIHKRLPISKMIHPEGFWRIRELLKEPLQQSIKKNTSGKKANIHVYTYATSAESPVPEAFCRMLRSALINSVDITVLGWGTPWSRINGMIHKVLEIWYEVHALSDPNDIVSFADGYDVLWTRSSQFLQRTFERVEKKTRKSMIFSAECACFPPWHGDRGYQWCHRDYPVVPTTVQTLYKFLNSGGWIGRVWAARNVLDQVILRLLNVEPGSHYGVTNDQIVIAKMFVAGEMPEYVGLDYETEMFQSMNSWQECQPIKDLRFDTAENNWIHLHQNGASTKPAMLHFPGEAKEMFYRIESLSWWYNTTTGRMNSLNKTDAPIISHGRHSSIDILNVCSSETFQEAMKLRIRFDKGAAP